MKIRRQKQAKHLLTAYRNFFGFHEPYRILVDGTFCKLSLQYNVQIKESLTRYLNAEIQCFTTRCVLAELEMLGSAMYGAKIIAQRFKIHSCSHKKKPITAQECLKSLIKDGNPSHFFLATQDFDLTTFARLIPGIPLLYIHQNNIVLDKMSKSTSKQVEDISQGKAQPAAESQSVIRDLKKQANLLPEVTVRRKRKGRKEPNPLSRLKSKKPKQEHEQARNEQKRKRSRRRTKVTEVDNPV